MEFDFLISLEDKNENSKKRVRICEEDNLTIRSTKTTDYFKEKDNKKMDLSSDNSAWGSEQPSVLK